MSRLTLLIAGDSFMAPDSRFPGQHWTEMLDKRYRLVNVAGSGQSQDQISWSIHKTLDRSFDAVIFGSTEPYRMDFADPRRVDDYVTNCHGNQVSRDQMLAYAAYRTTCDEKFESNKGAMKMLGLLGYLHYRKIPAVWSPMCFYHGGYPYSSVLDEQLSQFSNCMIPFNLAWQDPGSWLVKDPTFHILDKDLQLQFAQAVEHTLQAVLADS